MSEVKTYDLEDTGSAYQEYREMVEQTEYEGDWVRIDDYKELEAENKRLREEGQQFRELAINLIDHAVELREIQLKCFNNDYIDVKQVGMAMPSYQGFILQNRMKKISRITDMELCKKAFKILVDELESENES